MRYTLFLLLASTFIFTSCWRENPPAQDPNSQAPVEQNTPPLTDDLSSTGVQEAPPMEPVVEETETSSGTEENFSGKIADIYSKGGQVTCELASTQSGTEFTGKIFIDGKKMKSLMNMVVKGKNVQMGTLVLDDYSYNWDVNTKIGMKLKNSPEKENADTTDAKDAQKNEMDNETYKFTCKKGIDGVSFEVPSDIQFQDLSQMQNMMPVMNTPK